MILLRQMVVLFLIMLVGFLCRKKGLLNDESSKRISGLVVKVANPALILSASINQENVIEGTELLFTFLLAIGMYAVLLVIAQFLPGILGVNKKDYGIYKAMTVFSNIGFMGFPVISAVYGNEALLYASLFLIPYNILIYTYGVNMIRPSDGEKEPIRLKNISNIGVLACLVSVIFYLLKLKVPVFIEDTVGMLSSLTAPLSMIIIGDAMTKFHIKELLADVRLLIFSVIKLLLLPICGVFAVRLLGCDPVLTGVCMVMLATPVGSMTAMLAQEYDGNYELAAKGVTLTTVFSVATIPLCSLIMVV